MSKETGGPARIWVTGTESYVSFDRITASSLDHSGAGEGYEYPEYIRADLFTALEAENAKLKEALGAVVERSLIDPLGTSKVIDMRRIAEAALT